MCTAHLFRLAMAAALLLPSLSQRARSQTPDWMLGPFHKPKGLNPVITPNPRSTFRSPMGDSTVRWEAYATFNPAAVVKGGKVYLLYRAEDASGKEQIGGHTSRIGLAESSDGLGFIRHGAPVLYPDRDAQALYEWPGGVEDPRIVESEDGTYVLTYTQWNRDIPRLAIATSTDLISWQKHGPAFARPRGGEYLRSESKSGAILSRLVGERVVATKVDGKYWMYFGVPDVRIATSDNLLDWTPLEDGEGRPVTALSPRPGYFDSWLVEPGPPALLTEHGIVLLYNAANSATGGDPRWPARMYTGGQALFDSSNPLKLMARAIEPFIQPTEDYERTGQYREGTTFVEGLVHFEGRWHLYYGTADSRVGVAVWDPRQPVARSYDDMPPGKTDPMLANFSIAPDRGETIPILQRLFVINPHLSVERGPQRNSVHGARRGAVLLLHPSGWRRGHVPVGRRTVAPFGSTGSARASEAEPPDTPILEG